jgi:tetracycline 7-halogenase / FADH2 O2-dependent halogenase
VSAQSAYAVVVGSGFAGSLLSWILQRHGRQVLLVDRGSHPRFAIGESSTPTADYLLAYLSQRWSMPELYPLSAFGLWQQHYPHLRCGLKRGFSYYGHQADRVFADDENNSRSLLVAASATDQWSDTHWYREDVDAFLVDRARGEGVQLCENSSLGSAEWDAVNKQWSIQIESNHGSSAATTRYRARWLIDASGAGSATAAYCGHRQDDDWMRTRSSAIFGHFENVASFSQSQPNFEREVAEFFDSDHAAQHHVIEEGWYWALRFLGNRTSFGLVQPNSQSFQNSSEIHAQWNATLNKYPSIKSMMGASALKDPRGIDGLPSLAYMPRMSRCRSSATGPGWILLPLAYGFIDPLHSSGIAHALSGVSRVAECLLGDVRLQPAKLHQYGTALRTEVEWLDTLVSGCYQGLPSFECFSAYTAFYFAATIAFENQLASDPESWPLGYLNANDSPLRAAAEECWHDAGHHQQIAAPERFVEQVRQAIAPWNTVGLLDPQRKNRLNHTAPPKPVRQGVLGA